MTPNVTPPGADRPAPSATVDHVVAFSRLLRQAGLATHPQGVADACRAASLVDLGDRRQFYWALRANFVNGRDQFATFDRLFHLYWEEGVAELEAPPPTSRVEAPPAAVPGDEGREAPPALVPDRPASSGASTDEVLVKKDLRALAPQEEPRLREILQALLAKLATRPGRRYRTRGRGRRLALRQTLRRSARRGGEILELVHREPRLRRRRVAFLGDVSGSMDVYNRFFLLLAHALARQDAGVRVYAFATRLFPLTDFAREKDATRAVERVAEQTRGWSGGTLIGQCLAEFNEALARQPHRRHTVVVILSDGWDRGDPALLRRELARLKATTARLFWLNPLRGDPGYRPLCRGMATALPYLDGFHPAHNVESLSRFARRLTRIR